MLVASLRTARARDDVDVLAIVDTARWPPLKLIRPRRIATAATRELLNLTTDAAPSTPPLSRTLASVARRERVPLLAPRERGVNDAAFVAQVRQLEPDATVALMVEQIFRDELLAACRLPINYHNGLLPDYQGVAATAWSIYEQAPRSGFTFHRMVQEVDRGPVILQGSLPVADGDRLARVERAKTDLASSQLGALFDLLANGGADPTQPDGAGSRFTRADLRAISTVSVPAELTLDELERRLRAFECIELVLLGRSWSTTALRPARSGGASERLAFTTADGVRVRPSRLEHLPPLVHRALRSGLA